MSSLKQWACPGIELGTSRTLAEIFADEHNILTAVQLYEIVRSRSSVVEGPGKTKTL